MNKWKKDHVIMHARYGRCALEIYGYICLPYFVYSVSIDESTPFTKYTLRNVLRYALSCSLISEEYWIISMAWKFRFHSSWFWCNKRLLSYFRTGINGPPPALSIYTLQYRTCIVRFRYYTTNYGTYLLFGIFWLSILSAAEPVQGTVVWEKNR